MDTTSTLNDYADFIREEKKLLDGLGLNASDQKTPKKGIVASLLNYSKSLSIRKSEIIDEYEMILN